MSIPLSVAIISTSFSMPNLSRNSFGITIRPSLSISFFYSGIHFPPHYKDKKYNDI